MSGSSKAWTWRHAFASSALPATTKAVLHTLGMFMNELGEGCYPSVADICRYSGLDKKTVLKHLAAARDAGWIAVSQHGFRGQKWKRQEYAARWPERDLVSACPPADDERGGGAVPPPSEASKVVDFVPEGGGIEGSKVVEHVHQDKTSPVNIPNTPPSERGAREVEVSKETASGPKLPPEDNPKLAAFEKRVKRFCSGVGFRAGKWAGWETGARLSWIVEGFAKLSPDERLEAERWRDAYLLDVASQKREPQTVGNFLRDRTWEALDPAILKKAEAVLQPQAAGDVQKPDGWASGYGPVGMSRFFALLLEGPADAELAKSSFLPRSILAKAWPALTQYRDVQQQRSGAVLPKLWHLAGELMEPVPQGTIVLAAWKDEFKRRAWPWPSEFDRMQVVFCPRGGPSSVYEFEIALRGLGENDGN